MQKKVNFIKKGFTLSEVLLAACILAVVFASSIASFINCFILNEANRSLAIATSHASYVLEEIKDKASTSGGFNDVVTQINSGSWDWNSVTINSKGLAPLNLETIDTSVTGTNLLDIKVSVNWRIRGRDRAIALESLIAEP